MTVQSTSVQTSQVATGLITTFTYQFKLLNAADLTVQLIDISTPPGVHNLTLNSDYTVDPLGIGLDAGGNILNCTYLGANVPNGWTVMMTRETGITQDVDLANQGTYLPENVEGGLDTGITIQQEQAFQLARTIRGLLTDGAMPVLPAAAQRLGMYLQFDPVTGMPNVVPGAPVLLKDNFAASVAPTTANDNTQGYSEGSRWFDTVHNTVYICMSAATGAAVWVQLVVKNNMTAVTAPGVNNDNTQGYSINSVWLNTLTNIVYMCLNSATGAAVWERISPLQAPSNYFVDPCCRVAQGDPTTTLTTAYKYGAVDLVQCKATGTAVSAGTIQQAGDPNATGPGVTGFAAFVNGATITGTGKVFFRRWIESRDTVAMNGQTVIFSVICLHTVGSNINAFLTLNKFQSQDSPGTPTLLASNSGAPTSVVTSTPTVISLAYTFGSTDGNNGIELILEMDCGAVTTKQFLASDWQAVIGSNVNTCVVPAFADDYAKTLRYFEKSYEYGTVAGTVTVNGMIIATTPSSAISGAVFISISFKSTKLSEPSCTIYSPSTGTSSKLRDQTTSADVTVLALGYTSSLSVENNSGGLIAGGDLCRLHWTADARV